MGNDLFNEKIIKDFVKNIVPSTKQKSATKLWLDLIEEDSLQSEKRNNPKFMKIILQEILNYPFLEIDFERENVEFSFKKEGKTKVVIETKGTKSDLFKPQFRKKGEHSTPEKQIWCYMNNNPGGYGILTNYRIFVFYDYQEGQRKKHVFDFLEIKNNSDKLKEFIGIFSKESLIDTDRAEKIKEKSIIAEREFTKEFYKLYNETRMMMVREFEKENVSREGAIHFAQLFLNRLMFVFFAEDTGKLEKRIIEEKILNVLKNVELFSASSNNISNMISSLFNDLNKGSNFPTKIFGFNGGLFKNPIPPRIFFNDFRDDKFFKEVLQHSKLKKKGLKLNKNDQEIFNKYKGRLNPIIENILLMASYDFNSEVNVNILGHVFEQSISDLEDLKEKKVSRRKKEGVFYTPEYITDYICRNTIIPYLSKSGTNDINKLVDEYSDDIKELEDKFKSIKILDPACGSGAFLIKSVEIMLEIFKAIQDFKEVEGEYSAKRGLKLKSNIKGQFTLKKIDEQDEARQIIENNIHGVDINEESVEITKLSLFLKIARKNKKLIDLSQNIKRGNSLIDDEEVAGELVFDWNKEFLEIMEKGGFDVVVGNPPYGAKLNEKEVNFVKKNYSVGNSETAQLMMEKAHYLLKDNGYHGFIIPKAFTFVSTWDKIRSKFLDELNVIVDCKKVWKEVKLEQIIYTLQKGKKVGKYNSCIRDNHSIKNIANVDKSLIPKFDGVLLNSLSNVEIKIGSKIRIIKTTLGSIATNKWGDVFYKEISQDKKGFKVLGGNEIQRYYQRGIKGFIESKHIKTQQSLIKSNSVLLQRLIAHIENPTEHLKIAGTIFEDSNYRIVNTVHQVILDKEVSNKYVLALMNSNFMNWFVYRFVFAKAIRSFQFSGDVAKKIPIPKISLAEQKPFIDKAGEMLKLNKEFYEKKSKFHNRIKGAFNLEKINRKLDNFFELDFNDFIEEVEKQIKSKISLKDKDEWEDYFNGYKKDLIQLREKIDSTDSQIDKMVYELYGLTPEEIKVIEESLK